MNVTGNDFNTILNRSIDQCREFHDCETIEFDFNLGHRDQHMLSLCTRLDKQEKSYLREQLYN